MRTADISSKTQAETRRKLITTAAEVATTYAVNNVGTVSTKTSDVKALPLTAEPESGYLIVLLFSA